MLNPLIYLWLTKLSRRSQAWEGFAKVGRGRTPALKLGTQSWQAEANGESEGGLGPFSCTTERSQGPPPHPSPR